MNSRARFMAVTHNGRLTHRVACLVPGEKDEELGTVIIQFLYTEGKTAMAWAQVKKPGLVTHTRVQFTEVTPPGVLSRLVAKAVTMEQNGAQDVARTLNLTLEVKIVANWDRVLNAFYATLIRALSMEITLSGQLLVLVRRRAIMEQCSGQGHVRIPLRNISAKIAAILVQQKKYVRAI